MASRSILIALLTVPALAAEDLSPPSTEVVKRVPLNREGTVSLEVQGPNRRVLLDARVCLREGPLELLLTRAAKKEHEAVLAVNADGRDLHKALLLMGAKEGKPVQFEPKYTPVTGSPVRVTLRYERQGKAVTVRAQEWVKNIKTGKALEHEWVFGGSQLVTDPLEPQTPPVYAANSGDFICVSNFDTAILDIPVESPRDNERLAFEAFTERIPPVDTKVTVVLELIKK
jgi:hypothetical protein